MYSLFSCKKETPQFNVKYSHTRVFTFHLYIRLSRNEIKRCSQIEVFSKEILDSNKILYSDITVVS